MPMKVIVCFDDVRVTVPCGDGSILVAELISKAVHRYKRATGKGSHQFVEVTNLKSISGGGILDPDDQLSDVVDDREQLVAKFEEHSRPSLHHNGGDGASASSTGTVSPDFFHPSTDDNVAPSPLPALPPPRINSTSNNTNTDVIITTRDLSIGSNLIVRRGSEPSLNLLGDDSQKTDRNPAPLAVKRVTIPRRESMRDSDEPRSESSDEDKLLNVPMTGSLDRKQLAQSRFSRDAFRTSLSNKPEMFRWLEAQERQEQQTKLSKTQVTERTGPVEGHDGKDDILSTSVNSSLIVLQNDGGPLGIHAVPADANGENIGLLVQSVEPDRPVHRDGRIQPNDTIMEINGISLKNVPFLRAQEIFRSALDTKEICLKIEKPAVSNRSSTVPLSPKQRPAPPPPVLPKPRSHVPNTPSPLTMTSQDNEGTTSEIISLPSSDQASSVSSSTNNANVNQNIKKRVPSFSNAIKPGPPIRPPKKMAPAVPARSPNRGVSPGPPADLPVNSAYNTRKIGKKLVIELQKGPSGLGFSVTSRDNQTDGNTPIYIRNILPKGAAVLDGQLRPGDRLLEVNNFEMTGKTQKEAVDFLRELPQGSMVQLLVSRQEEVEEKFKVPRKMSDPTTLTAVSIAQPKEASEPDMQLGVSVVSPPVSISQPSSGDKESPPGQDWEKITFHVQLHNTGRAGLGVSVKGKTEPTDKGLRDLGIFVNSVLQGGAASKDGRLEVNDQLLEVNGINLEHSSNTEAMESLRMAMMDNSLQQGQAMAVTVSRRRTNPFSSPSVGSSLDSSNIHSSVPSEAQLYNISSSSDQHSSVVHQRSSSASELSNSLQNQTFGLEMDMPSPIPPVRTKRVNALRERFSESGNGLRNDSYHRATNDSVTNDSVDAGPAGIRNDSYMKATHDERALQGIRNDSYMKATLDESDLVVTSPIKNLLPDKFPISPGGKEIFSKNDNVYPQTQKTERPHSTIGFLHEGPRGSLSDDEAFRRESVASNGSDLSPSDLVLPFAREGFGRQSMSEKRKGHLDPRTSEIYKLVKANKENKGATGGASPTAPQVPPCIPKKGVNPELLPRTNPLMHVPTDSTYKGKVEQLDSGQSSLKRSSSVEDLSHNELESAPASTPSPSQKGCETSPLYRSNRFGRSRACNESFRAAVDRSYEVLDPSQMDILEEESAESGAFTLDPSNSGRSSISSENTSEDTNSLTRRKAKDKKTSGLLKGFLRFGKGRKSNEDAVRRSRSEERPGDRIIEHRSDFPDQYQRNDRFAIKPSGDAHTFVPLSVQESPKQEGRRFSNQEEERNEEGYARLREYQLANQRLRSQSVDPTMGRQKRGFTEQSSPIPHGQLIEPSPCHSVDPRTVHPAAMAQGHVFPGQDFRDNGQHAAAMSRPNTAKGVMSRAEYIQQLRTLYQQRHRQRQGVYPLDAEEEVHERQIQEFEKRQFHPRPLENTYNERIRRDQNFINYIDRGTSDQVNETSQRNYSNSTSFPNIASVTSNYTQQRNYHQPSMYSTSQPSRSSAHAPSGNSSHNSSQLYHYSQQHQHHLHYNNPNFDSRDNYHIPSSSSHEHFANHTNYSKVDSRSHGPPLPLYQGHPPSLQTAAPHGSHPYTHYRSDRTRIDSAKV